MSEETKLETIQEDPEPKVQTKVETKPEPVKEEIKETSPPNITNQTEDKELETNSKRKQRNKPLRKPTTTIPPGALSKLFNINPMYLLGIVGILIAGVSLWDPRKSYLQDEDNDQQSDDERDEGPKHSSGETSSNFFGPSTDDLWSEVPVQRKKSKGKEKKEKHFPDPFEWKKHQMGVWTFDG